MKRHCIRGQAGRFIFCVCVGLVSLVFAACPVPGGMPDSTRPSIVSISPSGTMVESGNRQEIVITFSENISRGSGVIRINGDGGVTFTAQINNTTSVDIRGSTLRLRIGILRPRTSYTLDMPAGLVRNAAGNGNATVTGRELFTTSALIVPRFAALENTALNSAYILFNQGSIERGTTSTGSIIITRVSNMNEIVNIDLASASPSTFTISGSVIQFPNVQFESGVTYRVQVPAGVVRGLVPGIDEMNKGPNPAIDLRYTLP